MQTTGLRATHPFLCLFPMTTQQSMRTRSTLQIKTLRPQKVTRTAQSHLTSGSQVWNSKLVALRLGPQPSPIPLPHMAYSLGSLYVILLLSPPLKGMGSGLTKSESQTWFPEPASARGALIPLSRPNVASKQHISEFVMKLLSGNHHPVWERRWTRYLRGAS